MLNRILLLCALFISFSTLSARAQTTSWVQLEAQSSLRAAEASAREYVLEFSDIAAFAISGGWYAVAIGPYDRDAAETRLRQLRAERRIPSDAFIVEGNRFRQQVFPIGENALERAPISVDGSISAGITAPVDESEPTIDLEEPEETVAQARRSERALNGEERRALQVALQWDGFYTSSIDGAFGPGTRRSMADYQAAMGFEPTGVLTTRQRAKLLGDYNAIFEALGLAVVEDDVAGISIQMPMGLVKFDKYEPPFVHYASTDNTETRVLLISQEGDRGTLFGLYEIMQTLEIVPLDGDRSKSKDSFVLTGQNADIHSYTYARYKDGQIKGFTLIHKPENQKLMSKVAEIMRETLASTGDNVLDPLAGDPTGEQSPDLLAGLEIRTPSLSRSGFYVDGKGSVLTTTEVLQNCSRITVDGENVYTLSVENTDLNLALLSPEERLTPLGFAKFESTLPRLRSELAISGYSYEGALGDSTVTFGELADLKGLDGSDGVQRVSVDSLPGDTGGPVIATSGLVIGALLSKDKGARALPANVRFAAKSAEILDMLNNAGIASQSDSASTSIAPEDLVVAANDMTVLVSCWE